MRRRTAGSALLMAVIFVSVVVTGSLVIGGLVLRDLNQQRNLETRRRLETSFQELFPYPQSRPSNLWRDFGYVPSAATAQAQAGFNTRGWSLQNLLDRQRVGDSDPAHNPPAAFSTASPQTPAWKGPYWQSSADTQNRPLDAWGRPLQLRYVTSPSAGWQVFSRGANGVDNTLANSGTPLGDDLAYPNPPYVVPPAPVQTYDSYLTLELDFQAGGPSGWGGAPRAHVTAYYKHPVTAAWVQLPPVVATMDSGSSKTATLNQALIKVPVATGKVQLMVTCDAHPFPNGYVVTSASILSNYPTDNSQQLFF